MIQLSIGQTAVVFGGQSNIQVFPESVMFKKKQRGICCGLWIFVFCFDPNTILFF
jgi:hypothetical protein